LSKKLQVEGSEWHVLFNFASMRKNKFECYQEGKKRKFIVREDQLRGLEFESRKTKWQYF